MNADLYTVLLFLGLIGVFLAFVVGRLQFSWDDDLHREVADKHKAVKSLQDDYDEQSEVAKNIGATVERGEFLAMDSVLWPGETSHGDSTPGHLFKNALALFEAIEHVDDERNAEDAYERLVEQLGSFRSPKLQPEDVKRLLRIARISIHAKADAESLESYRKQISAFVGGGDLSLSDQGKLQARDLIAYLRSARMQVFANDYDQYIGILEELFMSDPVSTRNKS